MAHPFRIHNTLSDKVEPYVPHQSGHVGLYVCGMTVYDHAHVGHARAMVVFDMVVRYLRHRGWKVTFVRNFTDVDDKIIQRAEQTGEDPLGLAERFIAAFAEDAGDLGLLAPDAEPRVSRCIPDILELIQMLVDKGHAYAAEGSVWFAVSTFESYGQLSHQKPSEMRTSPDSAGGKRHPCDFALWKSSKPGEPSWDSPWGPGRPGWHIECSAMVHKHLGTSLDIHGGGLDLVFPHHENEIAQSECAHDVQPYARYWMHNGLLTMSSGQKMGKSLGNVFNIREALKLYPAEAMRLYYLQVHYRSPLPWNDTALPEALELLARLYEAREAAEAMGGAGSLDDAVRSLGEPGQTVLDLARTLRERFYAAMDEDFNTAKALGFAFALGRAINRLAREKKAKKVGGPIAREALAALQVVHEALGLLTLTSHEFHEDVKEKRLPALGLDRATVEERLASREQARADKDWATADTIRGELEGKGIMVMDRPEGVTWRIRL